MKKILAFLLAFTMLLLCCGCGEKETATKKKKKVVVIKRPSTSTVDTENESDSSAGSDDSFIPQDNITAVTDTDNIVSKITAANIGSDYYVLSLETDHPGVVNYDAHYTMIAKDKRGRELDSGKMVLSCNNRNVKINGNKITVPYSVRSGDEKVTISMYDTEHPNRKGTYTFNFRKFSAQPTFDEEFNTLDTDVWWSDWYADITDTEWAVGEIKDGKYYYYSDNHENSPDTTIATSGSFKQAYGCFSASVMQPLDGNNGCAFWLCSDKTTPRKNSASHEMYIKNPMMPSESGGEIDIVEYSGNWKNRYATTMHWNGWSPAYTSSDGAEPAVDVQLGGVYNTYSCVWTSDAVYFYLNDQLTWVYTGEGVAENSGPMVILVSFWTGEGNNEWMGEMKEDAYPLEMACDWVRAWSLDN